MFFQNIFYFVFSLGFALSDATFILYHTQLSLSSVFWNFLLKHFVHTFLFTLRSFSLSFRSVWISFSLFQDSLNIISYFVCFVKRFFKKLSVFFLRFFGILWKPSGSLNPFSLALLAFFFVFSRSLWVSLFIIRHSLLFVNTFCWVFCCLYGCTGDALLLLAFDSVLHNWAAVFSVRLLLLPFFSFLYDCFASIFLLYFIV